MKLKKLAISLLLAACTFACACGDKGTGAAVTGDVVTEVNDYNYVEGMLHDVNVDFDNPVSDFVVNGQSDYVVITGRDNAARAGGFIKQHVYSATGKELPVYDTVPNKSDVSESTKYIFVGCEDLYKSLGGEVPTYEEIGLAGYSIQTYGSNVFINGCGYTDAYQMGSIAFLREVIGYDMLREDTVVYELDGTKMPAMDITERPDFDIRNVSMANGVEKYGMGFTYYDAIPSTGESWIHNIYDFVSLEEMDENPDWGSSDSTRWQMCFTSRGNKDTYEKLIYHLADKVKGFLIARPDAPTIVLGQHDIGGSTPMVQNCKCKACQASYEYYGNTMAGAWLSLCNRVSVVVDEWLKTEEAISLLGENFQWNFLQLVYHTHVAAPCEKNNNGYVLDEDGYGIPKVEMWFNNDGTMEDWEEAWTDADTGESLEDDIIKEWSDSYDRIYPAPNVHHFYATSAADWVHSYLEPENKGWKDICDAWTGVSTLREGGTGGQFYIWAYCLNSQYALYPYNSFDTFFESTRYFKSIGAKYMFWQGHYQNFENSGFYALKMYLESKVEFDVNADYLHYVDKWFKYAYGVAAEDMQDIFEQYQLHFRWMEQVNKVSGNIHNVKYGNEENWPEGMVNAWYTAMEDAIAKVEAEYSVTDPEKCALYKRNIEMEIQFPLIIQCTTYYDSYGDAELKEKRKYFMYLFNDVFGNKVHAEGKQMTEITDLWDLD